MFTRCEDEVDRLPHVPHCAPMIPRGEVLSSCVNRVVDGYELIERMHLLIFMIFL